MADTIARERLIGPLRLFGGFWAFVTADGGMMPNDPCVTIDTWRESLSKDLRNDEWRGIRDPYRSIALTANKRGSSTIWL